MYSLGIDVSIMLLPILWPGSRVPCMYGHQLIYLREVFLTAMMFTMVAVFLLYFSASQTSITGVQDLSLIVTTYNSTVLKNVNGMVKDIFIYRSKQLTNSHGQLSFVFIPIISGFVLLILFSMLFRFFTQIGDTFSVS